MDYSKQTDEALVSLTLLGNESAYENLVLRWQNSVVAAAKYITNDSYLAEDASQDAFVSAWLKLDTLREPQFFGAWVRRIVRNKAINIMKKNRDYLDYDDSYLIDFERAEYVDWMTPENNDFLGECIDRLPEKIRIVIKLYYIEGYPITEIAKMLNRTDGTVKRQLHDGREKIRKEYDIMPVSEEFVKEVMEKVKKLKNYIYLNKKDGFESDYDDVVSDIDKLPDNEEKFYAYAEVLNLGRWYLSDEEKKKEILTKIKDYAEKGKNDYVMSMVCCEEHSKFSGNAKIDYMKNVQLPYLEEHGFVRSMGYVLFWMGYEYFENLGNDGEAYKAFKRAYDILPKDDVYYSCAYAAVNMLEAKRKLKEDIPFIEYAATGEVWTYSDGKLRMLSEPGFAFGAHISFGYHSGLCDNIMYDENLAVGESITGSDGTSTLTHVEDGLTIETPCGTFENCELWCAKYGNTTNVWFKENVGIVKITVSGQKNMEEILCNYHIEGGTGMIPRCEGNSWEYAHSGINSDCTEFCHRINMLYSDDEKSVISDFNYFVIVKYDENSTNEMLLYVKQNYYKGKNLVDVSEYIEKAKKAVKTPAEKVYAETAGKVLANIYKSEDINPNLPERGIWNFFNIHKFLRDGSKIIDQTDTIDPIYNYRNGFEWKVPKYLDNNAEPVLYNFVYEPMQYNCGCVWNDEWVDGYKTEFEHTGYRKKFNVKLSADNVGTIVTQAGQFENCIKISFEVNGMPIDYFNGKKKYYYCEKVGLVRALHYYGDGKVSTYDLTEYRGTGEGWFPAADGMFRRYDAIDIDEKYTAYTEYTYVEQDGEVVVYSNQCGLMKKKTT